MDEYVEILTKYDEELKRNIKYYTIPKYDYDADTNHILLDIITDILHDEVFNLNDREEVNVIKVIFHNITIDSILAVVKAYDNRGGISIVFLRLDIDKSDSDSVSITYDTNCWCQSYDSILGVDLTMDNYNKGTDLDIKVNEILSDDHIEYFNANEFDDIDPESKWVRFLSDLAKYIKYDLSIANLDYITPSIIDRICESILSSEFHPDNIMDRDVMFTVDLSDNNVATFIIPYMIEYISSYKSGTVVYKILYYGKYTIIKGDTNHLKDFSIVRNITNFDNFRKYKEK